MASPHPGMHVLCPVCERPIPDLLGELTDEPAAINAGSRATDCYYAECRCSVPVLVHCWWRLASRRPPNEAHASGTSSSATPPGVDAWRAGVEQALQDEANNPQRDPNLPALTRTQMVT